MERMQIMIDAQIAADLTSEMEEAISQAQDRQNPEPDSHLQLLSHMDESSTSSSYSMKHTGNLFYPGDMPFFGSSSSSSNPPAAKKPAAPKMKKPPPVLPPNMRVKWGKYGYIFPKPKHP